MDEKKEVPRGTWLNPKDYPPPRGEKIFLLTQGNIATTGFWSNDCVGWGKLFDTPIEIKQEQARRYNAGEFQ